MHYVLGLAPRCSVDGYSTAQQSPEGGLPEDAARKISDAGVTTLPAATASKDGSGDNANQQSELSNQ